MQHEVHLDIDFYWIWIDFRSQVGAENRPNIDPKGFLDPIWKKLILEHQKNKTTKKRPEMPKGWPRPPQTLSKWRPRTPQIHFLGYFVFFFPIQIRIDLSLILCSFVSIFKSSAYEN